MANNTGAGAAPLVDVQGLSKRFCRDMKRSLRYGLQDIAREVWPRPGGACRLRPGEFWGLHDVNFRLEAGEALAIVGANGSGKSTLLKLVNGLLKPDAGRIKVRGRVVGLIELGIGFSHALSGRENIYANAALLGLSTREVDVLLDEIIDFSGVREFIDTPLQFYSKGMAMRLAFAVAVHLKPDVMLLDEILAVGDIAFQRKCVRHILQYLKAGGSVIFVGHSPHQSQAVCERGMLLEHGRMTFAGPITDTLHRYLTVLQDEAVNSHPGETNVASVAHSSSGRTAGATPAERGWGHHAPLTPDDPVAIEELTVRSASGQIPRFGEEAVIVARYRALTRFDDVAFGFAVFTADQWVCITAAIGPPFTIHPGSSALTVRVRLPLLPENYVVKAGLLDRASLQPIALIGWHDAAPMFRISAPPDWARVAFAGLNALVAVDVIWDSPGDNRSQPAADSEVGAHPAGWQDRLQRDAPVIRGVI